MMLFLPPESMKIELKEELAIESYVALGAHFEEDVCQKKPAQDEKCVYGQDTVQDELKKECRDSVLGIYFVGYV